MSAQRAVSDVFEPGRHQLPLGLAAANHLSNSTALIRLGGRGRRPRPSLHFHSTQQTLPPLPLSASPTWVSSQRRLRPSLGLLALADPIPMRRQASPSPPGQRGPTIGRGERSRAGGQGDWPEQVPTVTASRASVSVVTLTSSWFQLRCGLRMLQGSPSGQAARAASTGLIGRVRIDARVCSARSLGPALVFAAARAGQGQEEAVDHLPM